MSVSKEIVQRVAQLELRMRDSVSSLLSGNYRSAFRGSGMQFKEFRHYEPGDDIRHMSWPVTARTGRATIKVFEEDRELNVFLLVDVSGSSLFGSVEKRKIDMYSELLALIGLAAVKSKDNVGMMFFNSQPVFSLPPRDSRNHVLRGVTELMQQPLRNTQSDLRSALLRTSALLKKRSLVIVLSDFMLPSFELEMGRLARHHEMVLLHCFDDAERGSLPNAVFEVCDPETGAFYVLDGRSKKIRNQLAEHHVRVRTHLEDLCHKFRADYLSLSVEDDYLQRLVHFFKNRGPAHM